MTRMTFLEAIRQAQMEEMKRDRRVFLMGEDLVCNIFGTTTGFVEMFGKDRVRDTPISEAGFVGAAAGASMVGMRPIVDLTIASFAYLATDQICSIIAKSRYLYGGQASVPLVLRMCMFYGNGAAAQHSDRPYPMFMGVPGLTIIIPSNPSDMKGLLKSAIRSDDPVLCFEDGTLWSGKSDVPDDDEFLVPIGVADVKRPGTDITLVAIGGSVPHAIKAADSLSKEGISVEVIDPRTIAPMDYETILQSVNKTGRLVIADPAHRTCSVASEIAATVGEMGFGVLKAPIRRVTTPDTHIPFSASLEKSLYPSRERIESAVRTVVSASIATRGS
ncbi:MAG: alpha-ketoacid dehydrogenase subunit beta [Dehalococcoidia bacterium]